jgi:hypothetical protein
MQPRLAAPRAETSPPLRLSAREVVSGLCSSSSSSTVSKLRFVPHERGSGPSAHCQARA